MAVASQNCVFDLRHLVEDVFFYSELGLASEDRRNIWLPLLMVGHCRAARQMEGHAKARRVEQSLLRVLEGLGMML